MTEKLAGAELDALVAETVMGWNAEVYFPLGGNEPPYCRVRLRAEGLGRQPWRLFAPSTDWSAAGEVLERMQAQDYDTRQAFVDYLEGFVAHEYRYAGQYPGTRYTPLFLTPLAICRAALAAVRARKGTT